MGPQGCSTPAFRRFITSGRCRTRGSRSSHRGSSPQRGLRARRDERRQLGLGAVARLRVDRAALTAIHGQQFRTAEGQLLAQPSQGTAALAHGLEVVLADIGSGLVSRPARLHQPQHCAMARRRLEQAPPRTQAVAITVEVELHESARGIARAP
jgi:hypothetical protein